MTPMAPVLRLALAALVLSALLIAGAYASAFLPGGTPAWAPWLCAAGVPVMLVATMVLGAARGGRLSGRLALAFLLVGLLLVAGFALALGLPAEAAGAPLRLGLPLRAAIVVYGIGLLPILILPVAYALTFEAQTLRPEDLERVRQAGARARDAARGAAGAESP
ncbi:MAG TPA: hypothetical protein VFS40_08970 [Gemmatimonadales bacterium]|nr:hypothetical protein [Gemmatimonadales bacterium]